MRDENVEDVIEQFRSRSKVGIEKYGVTTDRDDLALIEWLQHLKEELQDATLYINRAQRKLRDANRFD